MRFLVLTGVIMAASTALVGSRPDSLLAPAAGPDAIGGAEDHEAGDLPANMPLVAEPAQAATLEPTAVAAPVDGATPPSAPRVASVIAFAPKTSPPRSR